MNDASVCDCRCSSRPLRILTRWRFGEQAGRGRHSLGVHQDPVRGGESRIEQAVQGCVDVRNVRHPVSPNDATQGLYAKRRAYRRRPGRPRRNPRCSATRATARPTGAIGGLPYAPRRHEPQGTGLSRPESRPGYCGAGDHKGRPRVAPTRVSCRRTSRHKQDGKSPGTRWRDGVAPTERFRDNARQPRRAPWTTRERAVWDSTYDPVTFPG